MHRTSRSAGAVLVLLVCVADANAQERRKPTPLQRCSVIQPHQLTQPPPIDSATATSLNWKTTADSIRLLVDSAGLVQRGFIVFDADLAAREHNIGFVDLDYPRSLRDEISRRIDDHLKRSPEPWRVLDIGVRAVPWDTASPSFVSCTPALRNREHITQLLRRAVGQYPGGTSQIPRVSKTVQMWLFINRDGKVALTVIKESSGDAYFDRAAKRIGRDFQFDPALRDGYPTEVWMQIPITFAIRRR
jgi:TonB family protein